MCPVPMQPIFSPSPFPLCYTPSTGHDLSVMDPYGLESTPPTTESDVEDLFYPEHIPPFSRPDLDSQSIDESLTSLIPPSAYFPLPLEWLPHSTQPPHPQTPHIHCHPQPPPQQTPPTTYYTASPNPSLVPQRPLPPDQSPIPPQTSPPKPRTTIPPLQTPPPAIPIPTSSPPPPLPKPTPTQPSTSQKDLSNYGTQSHDGTWRCAYAGCTSQTIFRRGCDLRKHFNRHKKHLFCRHRGCPQAQAGGFSSKKDRDRHEAKHNPGVRCEVEGCGRVFSRVDNMRDHVRRIHRGVV